MNALKRTFVGMVLLAGVASPALARAQDIQPSNAATPPSTDPDSDPEGLYVRIGLGIGVGAYSYPDGLRSGVGAMVSVSSSLAVRLKSHFIFGGTLSFDPMFGVGGNSVNGSFSAAFSPALFVGPMIGYEGSVLHFEGALGAFAGGTLGTGPPAYGAGGYGVGISVLAGVRVLRLGTRGGGLDINLHPMLGLTSDFNTGEFVLAPSVTVGASIIL